ncbi:MAG: hypothetical protein QM808_04430 [Steroidobacteraceae bacterium]
MASRIPAPLKKTTAPQPQDSSKPTADAPVDAKPSDLQLLDEVQEQMKAAINKGFDPYNSGAFDFRHTWQRIDRRK